jgi:hypothetical protein
MRPISELVALRFWFPMVHLQPRVHRLAIECEHGEDALVDAVERFALDESMQGLEPERVLADGERALRPKPASFAAL